MFVADSLYGGMILPEWLDDIVLTADVQRLRGIRLVNSTSPSLTSLSDARRYTHTLGVARLATEAARANHLTPHDEHALLAAAVSHDLATPPFGHLFEYLLSATHGWSHEREVLALLERRYSGVGPHHQIMRGHEARLGSVLSEHGISPQHVASIVTGQDPLGPLIAGSLDLDNVDNVFRMAHLLGMRHDPASALALAGALRLDDGHLHLHPSGAEAIQTWAATRRRVYELLAFDPTNLKAQAMLTEAIINAMAAGHVHEEHWTWSDEHLLEVLCTRVESKPTARRLAAGQLFETVFIGWYDQPKGEIDWRHPGHLSELRAQLETQTRMPCTPFVFYDRGTFAKALDIDLPTGCAPLPTVTSSSTIVGVFTPRNDPSKRATAIARGVLDDLGFHSAGLKPIPDRDRLYELPGQTSLAF